MDYNNRLPLHGPIIHQNNAVGYPVPFYYPGELGVVLKDQFF